MIHGRYILAGAAFVASVFVLATKVLNPTPIQIFVSGASTAVRQVPGYFTYADVVVIIISSLALAISGTYLVLSAPPLSAEKKLGELVLEERKRRWKEVSKTLGGSERAVYEAVLNSNGIALQNEVVERTGLSKSNVTRALDLLESKGLAERKRRGMGNIVLLK